MFSPLTRQAVVNCSFSVWTSYFPKRYLMRSAVVALPNDFLEYLESDGIVVPVGSQLPAEINDDFDANGSDLGEATYSFPELDAEIRSILERFDDAVFPKLNWTSPQDAAWINASQTLLCRSPADVYLLIKASDFCNHDLYHAFDGCIDRDEGSAEIRTQLVLKKWVDMARSNEFRCFVKERQLTAIAQRDVNYYDFLQDRRPALVDRMLAFFNDVVKETFPDTHYTFDIYFTRDFERIFLVDFNPWASHTDSLLFTWDEIHNMTTDRPVLRLVGSETQASQSQPRYAHNRVPKDVLDLSTDQSVVEFAASWQMALAEATAEAVPAVSADDPER